MEKFAKGVCALRRANGEVILGQVTRDENGNCAREVVNSATITPSQLILEDLAAKQLDQVIQATKPELAHEALTADYTK